MYWLIIPIVLVVILFILRLILNRLIIAIRPNEAVTMPGRRKEPTDKIIHVNGFDHWVRETGNPAGPPIIILHGVGLSSNYFGHYLDFLEKDYRVIYYDQRGSGLSEFKSDCRLYTFDGLIEDLDAIIKATVNEQKVVLMGHSFGATIALKYALDHKERVAKLILVSNGVIKSRAITLIPFFFQFYKGSFPPIADPEATNQWYYNRLPDLYRETLYHPENVARIDWGYASYATMLSELKSMGNFDLSGRLMGFDLETLMIHGVKEPDAYSRQDQVFLHQALKNSTMIQFDQSGHWSFLEEPEKFQQTVLEFLKK